MQRFEEAITVLQDAAAIFRETGDRHGEGMALNNLGGALLRCGGLRRRSPSARTPRPFSARPATATARASALTNLSIVLLQVQRFEEAITALQDAAAIFRETGDRHGEDMTLSILEAARTARLPRRRRWLQKPHR